MGLARPTEERGRERMATDDDPASAPGPDHNTQPRRIAADQTGTWRRIVTDDLGNLIDYGTTRYRPPAALRDHIVARDRTERFPGSMRGPRKSEIDHIEAWIEHGETKESNLHLLSKRSQTLKHDAGWTVERLPDGTTHWTTPQGRHHYQPPDPYPIDTTSSGAESDHDEGNGPNLDRRSPLAVGPKVMAARGRHSL